MGAENHAALAFEQVLYGGKGFDYPGVVGYLACVADEGYIVVHSDERPVAWGDVEVADARLRAAFGELRGEFGELRGEFGELRGEFGELRGEFGELRGKFGELRGELGGLKGYIDSALAKQTRTYVLALVGFAVTIWLTLLLPAIF